MEKLKKGLAGQKKELPTRRWRKGGAETPLSACDRSWGGTTYEGENDLNFLEGFLYLTYGKMKEQAIYDL